MWQTGGTFMADYIAQSVEDMRAAGKPAAEIAAFSAEMGAMAEQYKNPLFRMALTLTEIFPRCAAGFARVGGAAAPEQLPARDAAARVRSMGRRPVFFPSSLLAAMGAA
jgi:hypothetical protein